MKRLFQLIDLHVVYVGSLFSGLHLILGYTLHSEAGPADPGIFYVNTSVFVHLAFLLPRIIIRAKDKSKVPGSAAPYLLANILVAGLFGVVCGLLIFTALSRAAK